MILNGKKVLVGITSGIACYKVLDYLSKLKKLGVDLEVIVTNNALNFITTKSISAIISKEVHTSDFLNTKDILHINLAKWADCILILPATANIIAKTRAGICDDLLSSTILAGSLKPKIFAPSMNTNMYLNPITKGNIDFLSSLDNYFFIPPESDLLLCGDCGVGKMPCLDTVIFYLEYVFSKNLFKGKNITVTYGGTKEFFDPVRFISNPSTGKMGYSFIYEALLLKANVLGINCNAIDFYYPPINFKEDKVVSFSDLESSLNNALINTDVLIMTAAVSDYSPLEYNQNKIKKSSDTISINLKKNKDLLKSINDKRIFKVGFAMETENSFSNAKDKLISKGLDLIVLNDLNEKGAGFRVDTNVCTVITKDLKEIKLGMLSKRETARRILEIIASIINE